MSLAVEVAGFGLCQTASPYSIFVICVQQESYQGWTVYRRYNSFIALGEQLKSYFPGLPMLPYFDPNNMTLDYLESFRLAIDSWLQTLASNHLILRTQCMYQFLCVDANLPPPYLHIYWRHSENKGYDEMEMEEMFDKEDTNDDGFNVNSCDDLAFDIEDSGDFNNHQYQSNSSADGKKRMNSKKNMSGSPGMGASYLSSAGTSLAKKKFAFESDFQGSNRSNGAVVNPSAAKYNGDGSEDHDGLDILSLSYVEAEFLYDKADNVDGKLTTSKITAPVTPTRPKSTQNNGGNVFAFPTNGTSSGNAQSSLSLLPASTVPTTNGNNSSIVASVAPSKKKINLDSFHIIRVIGKGSFGKVFLAREKATNTMYALKVLKKEYIILKNQVEHTRTERSVLGYVNHPFIVGLNMAFQSADKLFFVLDYCAGGELFFHLGKVGRFAEERAKFYAAQIILALEYVHSLDIVYRDLKPENVLIDHLGNVRLTDFGLSKEGVSDHSTGANSFCGTPEYIAPEVLQRLGHGRAVDWWSLGALLYEMIAGLPPFYSRNREVMFDKIMKADLTFPPFMTEHARDILTKLLNRDPRYRLGSGEKDAEELKVHPFFADVDWERLYQGKIQSPWTPTVTGSMDTSQFDQEFTSMAPAVSPDVRGTYFGSVDRTFEGFSFVDESAAHLIAAHNSGGSYASSFKTTGGVSMSGFHRKN